MHSVSSFFWTLFWLFALFAYLLALFSIITDLFRDHELSGWWKALWLVFLFFLPVLTALVYLIARGKGMALRSQSAAKQNREAVDTYIRDVAGGHAAEIEKAKGLLDSGAISQAEYDQLKAKILS
ncbi:MAG: hypothetical protein ABS81_08340 [Pseudonocardia sp. SCN 72-86]|nr:MAG: hypothetical protein ABS81_08340 [Pseudonocardia sp. SCN 72-86]